MTKIIGLTGGIGSGKTTIGNYFESLGIPVYVADEAARKITDLPETVRKIQTEFGATVVKDGKLDRAKLASIVFNDKKKLAQLNAIVHPAVHKHFQEWLGRHRKVPLVVKEAAILFESGSYRDCDFIICVVAPVESRIERVTNRDKLSREAVLERVNNQMSDAERIARSDFFIENSDLAVAKAQADEILKKLLNV